MEEVGLCAMDGLRSEEIMTHGLDVLGHFGIVHNIWEILQDQPPSQIRILCMELQEVLTNSAADVYQQHILILNGVCVEDR